jgi:hypothetical protein
MPLPNLLIVGAHKCGTTSLHAYLDQHPEISMSTPKELNFFVDVMNWPKGFTWYERHFRTNTIVGESSVLYSRYPRGGGVPERIHRHLPDVKLIYIVRDPVDRVRSHFIEVRSELSERRAFETVLRTILTSPEPGSYLDTSRYAFQLEQYEKHFSPDRILVLFLEDLVARPQDTLRRVFEFLGVRADFPIDVATVKNSSSGKRELGPIARALVPDAAIRTLRYPRPPWLPDRVATWTLRLLRTREVEAPEIPENLEARLVEAFREDVGKLRAARGPLPESWRQY